MSKNNKDLFAPPTKDELQAIQDGQMFAPPTEDEIQSTQDQPEDPRSAGQIALDAINPLNWLKNMIAGVEAASEALDAVTGAPVRKAVTELATGQKLDHAPSGKDQAKMLGLSDKTFNESLTGGEFDIPVVGDMSPAGVTGFGLQMVQDPLIPLSAAAGAAKQTIGKGVSKIRDFVSKGAASGKDALKASGLADEVADAMMNANPNMAGIVEKTGGKANVFKDWPSPMADMTVPDSFKRMREIEYVVPDLKTPPQPLHYEMMKSGHHMRDLKNKIARLTPKEAEAFNNYNAGMLKEAEGKILEIPSQISGTRPRSIADEGSDIIGVVRDTYNNERNKLAPLFDELKLSSQPLSADEGKDLAIAIMGNSRVSPGLYSVEDGLVTLNPNKPRFGISDQEYKVLKTVIDDLNNGATFEEIQKMREYMRKAADPANPRAFTRLNEARKVMLDYLEGMTSQMEMGVDAAGKMNNRVHTVFQQFAKNERAKDAVETIIGGSIDSADALFAANPEKVVQKILSNPKHVEALRAYVGPDKINEIMAAYIEDGIKQAIHPTQGFKPHQLQNWMKKNAQVLKNNVPPEAIERLNALADLGWMSKRFLDQANPSGTADALKSILDGEGVLKNLGKLDLPGAANAVGNNLKNAYGRGQVRKELGEISRQPKPSPIAPQSTIERARILNEQRKIQKQQLGQ